MNSYAKNVLTLVSGTTIAQIIPIAITPILTRLYTPSDFSIFAMYSSILYIISVVMCARYEFAILLPKTNKDALSILILCVVIAICVSLLTLLFSFVFGEALSNFVRMPGIKNWLWLLSPGVLTMALLQAFGYYCNRNKKYTVISISRIYRSISASITSLITGFTKLIPVGLIAGDLAGQFVGSLFLINKVLKEQIIQIKTIKRIDIKTMAIRYINFPKFQIASGLLEKSAGQAPIFLLANLFANQTVGYFSLSQRIIISPSGLISGAIGDVFRQEASNAFIKNGNAKEVFEKTFRRLLIISILPFFLGYFIIEDTFTWILGNDWVMAGHYAKTMMPMFFLQFIVSPLSVMFVVAEKQKYDLVMQFFLFFGCSASFLIGHYLGWNETEAIQLFTIVYCIKYLIEFLLAYKFSKGNMVQAKV